MTKTPGPKEREARKEERRRNEITVAAIRIIY